GPSSSSSTWPSTWSTSFSTPGCASPRRGCGARGRVRSAFARGRRTAEAPSAAVQRSALRRFARDPAAGGGCVVVRVFAAGALGAPLWARNDPLDVDPVHPLLGMSWTHPFGTDNLGRDTFARILYGSRLSLGTAAVAAIVVLTVGVLVGLLSGLRGGWVDGL